MRLNEDVSIFIHFLGHIPSVLQALDETNTEARHTLIESTALALEPRPDDRGWPSHWEASNSGQENNIDAGFAARRRKKQKLGILRLPKSILQKTRLKIKSEPNNETFSCIADLHRLVHLASEASRLRLATELRRSVESGETDPREFYCSKDRKEISGFIIDVYKGCASEGMMPEIERAEPWARELIEQYEASRKKK